MINTSLVDGHGSGNRLKINGEGELAAVVHPHPPRDEAESALPFRQKFENAGSDDMQVAGTLANPINFDICADSNKDIYIGSIFVTIADAGAVLNKFGNVTALTNGCRLIWINQSDGEIVINDSLKSNWDWVKQMGQVAGFGSTTSAFRASNVNGSSEGYPIFIDFALIFKLPYGIRLRRGTTDCVRIEVRDTTTGVDEFTAVGYGLRI